MLICSCIENNFFQIEPTVHIANDVDFCTPAHFPISREILQNIYFICFSLFFSFLFSFFLQILFFWQEPTKLVINTLIATTITITSARTTQITASKAGKAVTA